MHNITQRIRAYNRDLLPDMVQIKYRLMSDNMYTFFRGSCHIFYQDLAKAEHSIPPSPLAWICGDLHLENFGSYKADNRLVHFDLNDFDEAVLAPASWELVRLVTSIFVAFESLKIDQKKAYKMALLFLRSYSNTLANGKAYYIESKTAKGIIRSFLNAVSKRKKRELIEKRTDKTGNGIAIKLEHPRHFGLENGDKRDLIHHINDWILNNSDGPYNYEVRDAAFRLAGTGSVGLKRYAFVLENLRNPGKFILLDMKQARTSSVLPYLKVRQPQWATEAERIVAVQQRMQNIPPALLSHTVFRDESYLIQEMQPVKDSIDFRLLDQRYRDMYQVIDDMAMLTASAQLRSSGRQGAANADELIAFGQNNQWQEVLLQYAMDYAAQVKEDHKKYLTDYKKGDMD